MKKLLIIVLSIACGIVFLFVYPREVKNTVYNDGLDCVNNPCLLWYSQEVNINVRGIPFGVDLSAIKNRSQSEIGKNNIKAVADFVIGTTAGFAATTILLKIMNSKKQK